MKPPSLTVPQKVKVIKIAVAEHFGITVEEIDSRRRPEHIAWPRAVTMFFCSRRVRLSTPRIGEFFQRDHSAVVHAIRRLKRRATKWAYRDQVLGALKKVKEVGC